jgi:hypothetical protein
MDLAVAVAAQHRTSLRFRHHALEAVAQPSRVADIEFLFTIRVMQI